MRRISATELAFHLSRLTLTAIHRREGAQNPQSAQIAGSGVADLSSSIAINAAAMQMQVEADKR